jgi:DNA processing protein
MERFALALMVLPGVARKTAWKAVRAIPRVPETEEEFWSDVSTLKDLRSKPSFTDAKEAWESAGRILSRAHGLRIEAIAAMRPDFPAWLQGIPDPPLLLWVRGNMECIRSPLSVAVVGTREPTNYGGRVAHRFGQRAAEQGFIVVSGLAIGCDTAGHRGCVEANGQGVAVLAHGPDRIYPKESEPLAEELLEKGGCWVSEYPPGTRAQRGYFVERDRLQSGLSGGVIVVETDVVGGTMHTAKFTQEQGKPLACLSHPENLSAEPKAQGNRQLIREGKASPLATAQDLSKFFQCVRDASTQCPNGEVPLQPVSDAPGLFAGMNDGSGSPF